jgi:hypothetical protein
VFIDVYSHTPRHKEPVAAEDQELFAMWRPDKARPQVVAWPDYMEAMEPVDKAIVFNIAGDPQTPQRLRRHLRPLLSSLVGLQRLSVGDRVGCATQAPLRFRLPGCDTRGNAHGIA